MQPDFLTLPWTRRSLISRLARREIEARYRGSFFGAAWVVLMPLVMIAIYSFVFGTVFRARWATPAGEADTSYNFAMLLFGGLIVFNIFSDAIVRSPGLVLENQSYVKKVVFPLEILPWVVMATVLFNAFVTFVVFMAFYVALYGLPPVTILLLPLVVLPIVLITIAGTYIFSSLGVFLRDLRLLVPLLATAMLFMSPVFFPVSAVPEAFRPLMLVNPLTIGINEVREVIFWGTVPDPAEWLIYTLAALIAAWAGHAWFTRTKKAFADVL